MIHNAAEKVKNYVKMSDVALASPEEQSMTFSPLCKYKIKCVKSRGRIIWSCHGNSDIPNPDNWRPNGRDE